VDKTIMAKTDSPNLLERLKTNVGWWFILGMGVLLLLRLLMMLFEPVSGAITVVPPTKSDPVSRRDSQEGEVNYLIVKKFLEPWKPFNQSDIKALAVYNMFDPKPVQNPEVMDRQATDMIAQAKAMAASGNLQGARDLVTQARWIRPNNLAGIQLQAEIDRQLNPPTTNTLTRTDTRVTTGGPR
jgi:hypothetical protein